MIKQNKETTYDAPDIIHYCRDCRAAICMPVPFVEFHGISFSYWIITRYLIPNVIKGFYTPPFLIARFGTGTLIEHTSSVLRSTVLYPVGISQYTGITAYCNSEQKYVMYCYHTKITYRYFLIHCYPVRIRVRMWSLVCFYIGYIFCLFIYSLGAIFQLSGDCHHYR
jgi:hypothetical protein